LVKTDLGFGGWNTLADGTGTTYTPGPTLITGSSNLTLYVKWRQKIATILLTFPSGGASPRPEGIAWDGTWIWVSEVNEVKVYKIDPSNGSPVSSYSIPSGSTHALTLDGAGRIWTTTYWADPPVLYRYPMTFAAYDLSLTLASTIAYPTAMAFDSTNNCIWVVNTNSANPYRFWKLDPANGSVLDTWDLSGGTPATTYGLCMDSDPNYLWMTVGNTLSKVSISGRQVVDRYVVPSPATLLKGVARVSSDTFWLVEGNNTRILKVQLQ
jgi:DNA-binding beta-propeller fold protein YncE